MTDTTTTLPTDEAGRPAAVPQGDQGQAERRLKMAMQASGIGFWEIDLVADRITVAAKDRLQAIMDAIPDLIWLKDLQGIYRACNTTFERFFGAAEAAIVGRTDYDFVERELADSFRAHDAAALAADGPSVNEDWLSFAADGYRGLFETIKTPLRDAAGQPVGVVGARKPLDRPVGFGAVIDRVLPHFGVLAPQAGIGRVGEK